MTVSASPGAAYYYGWNIVAVTALCQAASFGVAINCLSLYIPAWSRDLAAPVSTLALCYTVSGGLFCLLAPAAGAAADRLSVRIMMVLGLLGVAGLFGLAALVTNAVQLIALFATIAPVSMVIAGSLPSQVLVSRWFDRRRGLAIGLSAMGLTVAGAVLPPILALAIPILGWRALFLVIAATLACLCAPIAFLGLRDRPAGARGAERELEVSRASATVVTDRLTSRAILVQPVFWRLARIYVVGGFMSSGVLVNMAPLALNRGLTTQDAAALLSAFSLCTLATKLAAGFAIDRFGGRIVMMAILACGVAGVLALKFAGGFAALLGGVVLVAGCGAMTVPVATLAARQFGAVSFGRAMGMIVMAGLGAAFAPPIVAFLRERTESYDAPLWGLAVIGVAALADAALFRDLRRARLIR
ncbi:MFS transporter [Phenylobacterium immobile]|uniref:MFS transporter n=1 Tax=Phenylobacterium immobile TaxID=21 RepID=UPI000A8A6A2B|nr:MFS transporter [Phenylobacterium immobile]